MTNRFSLLFATTLCTTLGWVPGFGQTAPPVILQVDLENRVQYFEDTSDISKFASSTTLTTTSTPKDFGWLIEIGDVVAINGQPVGGTLASSIRSVFLRPAPTPGQAVADTMRNAINLYTLEIVTLDGTPIGTILASGLGAGSAPPGASLDVVSTNAAIVGGTGAFLGARGQLGNGPSTVATRQASITEDPANRRANGGGKSRLILHVIPMTRPEIATTAAGPAIFHADFSPVTAANPAKAGEVLIGRATGLGPTVPGVNPGQPFPADAAVNSPLAVSVNGKAAEVINGVGWPGQVDTYRVDFRVPPGTPPGTAAIQLIAAWIPGSAVNIPVQ